MPTCSPRLFDITGSGLTFFAKFALLRVPIMRKLIIWLAAGGLCLLGGIAAESAEVRSVRHDLRVVLDPPSHRLTGIDQMQIEPHGRGELAFFIAPSATEVRVLQDGRPVRFSLDGGSLRVEPQPPQSAAAMLHLTVSYAAVFDDPAPVLPVNTDNPGYGVTGTIGDQGTFLLAGAGWYPQIAAQKATYRVQVEAPRGIVAVTAGRDLGIANRDGRSVSVWQVDHPVQGLALSAAAYQVAHREVGAVTASTYFLPGSQHLAQSYLQATQRYIRMYEELFGPYPFPKFAVVENFFPTGYGFPSYTLLGSRVLQLPFIIDTSLGHEIAHCWWGNGVLVDSAGGNWSEALTTYVADYLYQERASAEQAFERRRTILRNYASLVTPADDFPLRRFQGRIDPVTRTVGYDKGAMVFHMLRVRLGEQPFWESLKDVYRRHLFEAISWRQLQQAFEERGNTSLDRFFAQWVDRSGAPQVALSDIALRQQDGQWLITGRVVQQKPYFDLTAELLLQCTGRSVTQTVHLSGPHADFRFQTSEAPEELVFDPQSHLFRRLAPSEIPPSINSIKGAPSVLVVLADGLDTGIRQAVRTLVLSLGLGNARVVDESTVDAGRLKQHDLLLVGVPKDRSWLPVTGSRVFFTQSGFVLDKTIYDRGEDAFFGVGSHPFANRKVAGIFVPLSAAFAEPVARKITHYGKYSYLAFSGGTNRAKGIWPVESSPVIYRWPVSK